MDARAQLPKCAAAASALQVNAHVDACLLRATSGQGALGKRQRSDEAGDGEDDLEVAARVEARHAPTPHAHPRDATRHDATRRRAAPRRAVQSGTSS